MKETMRGLPEIRKEMIEIDGQIAQLYQKRMQLTREEVNIRHLTEKKMFGFTQTERFEFGNGKIIFQGVDAIVFQGVEGAYSQLALKEYFGPAANGVHVETWRDAMEAIAGGEAACAVLPIENSSTGIVSENFDLLAEYDNCIIGEQIIRANHCLMGVPGAKLSDITDVYSHPQALMQCSKYLDAHTGWEKHSAENTAVSAMKVQKEGKRTQAAIAGKITAEIYGLNILAEGIQNHSSNSTRFIVVAKQKVFRKDAKKISVCFEIPHVSGSLYHTLSHLIYNNLNMNKIESRPIQGRTWEYRFFIDIDGNLADGAVQNALQALWGVTVNLRILGNY